MTDTLTLEDIKQFVIALALTQPRILALFVAVPVFARGVLPGMLRLAVSAGLGAVVAPSLLAQLPGLELGVARLLGIVAKEVLIGFVMGFLIAVPFWAFEGLGFIIDNQRGASIASTLNPLTGNDSSPMGELFHQAFVVFFFVSGGFLLMLQVLYDSFQLWNLFTWTPHLRPATMPLLIEQIMGLMKLALLLAAPAVVAMFLSEVGLALVSRFVPNLQVFFLAMPIKSAVAVLVMMVYMSALFQYAGGAVHTLHDLLPMLDGQWRPPPGVTR